MVLTYTERMSLFTITATQVWRDYDIFTNLGVPKGAIAEIVIANKNVGSGRGGGVRTDGSSLTRIIYLHEAEGGGVTTVTMLVKVHPTTGLIECWATSWVDIDFYLVGYFTGCDFTELIGSFIVATGTIWADKDLTPWGIPANAVVQMPLGQEIEDEIMNVGVRAKGSSLARIVTLDDAEPGWQGFSSVSMMVKADSSSIVEVYNSGPRQTFCFILGYFSQYVDFTEGFASYDPTVDNTWTSKTITEPPADAIISFVTMHEDKGAETFCGLREEGSALERRIEEHEAEGNGWSGLCTCITINGDKKCMVYCEDASEAHFFYAGYFEETTPPPPPTGKAFLPPSIMLASFT